MTRLGDWWRRHVIDDEPRGAYDTRPVYEIAPEDDPGMGGVPGAQPTSDAGPQIRADGAEQIGHYYGLPVVVHPDTRAEVLKRLHDYPHDRHQLELRLLVTDSEEGMGTKGEWRM